MTLVLRPNADGLNGDGMSVRYARGTYILRTPPPGAMGSHVWAIPAADNDSTTSPERLMIYDRRDGKFITAASRVRQ